MKQRSVEIELGGQILTLRMNLNTMSAFEEAAGLDIRDIGAQFRAMKVGTLRLLLTCLLSDSDSPPTAREVGRLVDWGNLQYVTGKLNELMTGRAADPRSLAPFVPTPQIAVEAMLDAAELRPGETLVDLGAGDGRIIEAALRRGALSAIGYELDAERYAALVDRGLDVRHVDAMEAEIRDADVITVYLLTESNERLRTKFERECRPGARIVSYMFDMPGWPQQSRVEVPDTDMEHIIYCWRRPVVVAQEAQAVSV
jgi:hypothetical protein